MSEVSQEGGVVRYRRRWRKTGAELKESFLFRRRRQNGEKCKGEQEDREEVNGLRVTCFGVAILSLAPFSSVLKANES